MSATKHNSSGSGIGGSPYQVPPEPNRWPSIGMAVGVHALLLAFLVVGINWQNNQPVAVEAEVWDMKVQSAAPPAPTPPPQPEPEPAPEPETSPPPARVVEPPKVEQPAPPKPPDIALEREKKRKEELLKRKEEERVERERERERELAQQKRDEEKKAKALAEKKELAKKEEAQKKELAKKEEAEKKELAKKEEAEKKKKAEKELAAKEKAAKEKAEKAENAKLAQLRADEMKRMMAGAGNPGSTGSAEKSTAPRRDNGYIAAITAAVKSKAHYGGSLDEPGNPTATFRVEQAPTGDILSIKMTKSSGVPAFDDAVKRAIDAASPLPKKKDGTVERSLEINFHMKDMQ
jgi:colicin import membrane protein